MSDRKLSRSELSDLVAKICHDALPPQDLTALEAALRTDPVAAQFYKDYMLLHAELSWRGGTSGEALRPSSGGTDDRSSAVVPPAIIGGLWPSEDELAGPLAGHDETAAPTEMSVLSGRDSERSVAERLRYKIKQIRNAGEQLSFPTWRAIAALLLLALGILGVSRWYRLAPEQTVASDPQAIVANLVEASQGVQVQRRGLCLEAVVGMALYPSDVLLAAEDASAALVMLDASRVDLGPDSRLALQPDSRSEGAVDLSLESGLLSVEAATQREDRPLRVFTAKARADVLGTRFMLATNGTRTNLRVSEGCVKLTRLEDGASVQVAEGHRSSVDDQNQLATAPALSGTVLVIVGEQNFRSSWERFNRLMGSRLLGSHLHQLSLRAEFKHHQAVQPADLIGRPLVIVAHSPEHVGFEESLQQIGLPDAPVPVICLEPIAMPVLGLTGDIAETDFSWQPTQTTVTFREPTHPLSAGLSGDRADMAKDVGCFGWARPVSGATLITVISATPDRAAIFGFDAGAQLLGRVAPARRVGMLLAPSHVDEELSVAWALFEAAVNWCTVPLTDRAL